MTSHRLGAIAVAATFAVISSPAVAASFDGYWGLIAQTTNGHCGANRFDVAISGGRFYYPGGFLMGWPVRVAGAVSAAGRVQVTVTAGPRIANGAGRLSRVRGSGRWAGQGPSGTCAGVWTAARVQPATYAPSQVSPPFWPPPYR